MPRLDHTYFIYQICMLPNNTMQHKKSQYQVLKGLVLAIFRNGKNLDIHGGCNYHANHE